MNFDGEEEEEGGFEFRIEWPEWTADEMGFPLQLLSLDLRLQVSTSAGEVSLPFWFSFAGAGFLSFCWGGALLAMVMSRGQGRLQNKIAMHGSHIV